MDEQALVRGSKSGDVQAFNCLVEVYQSRVYNLSLRLLGNPEGAADATQETFVSAFQGIGKFRDGNFKAWLLRIATNACHDQLRAYKRRPTTSLDSLMDDPENPVDFPDHEESPEDHALRQELAQAIQSGLSVLPFDQRVAVVLSDVQGHSYEEIATITNSSLGTVKSRLSRGRARMRDFLLERRELLPHPYRL
ncbi:MAG: sigma-70 family RNA polymerase sigma factor [Chloroflexi bacterium]|nr:sigma-70 family RNA polymerase sigma factor [Chloroflexota bacterium]